MLIETYFLVPIREDKEVGDGQLHKPEKWKNLQDALYRRFGGHTHERRIHYVLGLEGDYADGARRVVDESRKYVVALERQKLSDMRCFLEGVADDFRQKEIYFHVAGPVEFIKGV